MRYYQEKLNVSKQLNSTAELTLEIDNESIIYRGIFYMEFKKRNVPDGVTFNHELYIDKKTGDILITYEIGNKKTITGRLKNNSWIKKNNFDKLSVLTEMGFYRGEKRAHFWGVKYEKAIKTFMSVIKNDLQSEIKSVFLKNKDYEKPVINGLYDLIVDYHLYKKGIKAHDNVYQNIQSVYPKKKWLKLNDNKFLPAILDEYGIKSKYLIKELSIAEHPAHMYDGTAVHIRGLIYICRLFGENYIDYIKKFDWRKIACFSFNRQKKHVLKNENEKKILVSIFHQQTSQEDPKVRHILDILYILFETRIFLEEHEYKNLKIKLKSPEDIGLLLECWLATKKHIIQGYVLRYKIPENVLKEIQTPIIIDNEIFYPKVLLSDNDFCSEGFIMKNCMSKQFTHGLIHLYISLSNGKKKVNLQYQKGKIQQSFGKANSLVPQTLFGDAINELNIRLMKYVSLTWEREKINIVPK
jgi:hypothetical protein